MSNILVRAWDTVKSWVTSNAEVQTVMVELTAAEHTLLEKFHPLWNQILSTVGTEGFQIVQDALVGVMTTVETGGNIGAGISAAASQALTTLEVDGKAAAKNAVYGLLAAAAASLPVAVSNVSVAATASSTSGAA